MKGQATWGHRSILAAFGIEATRVRRVAVNRPAYLGNENWHVWTRAGERFVLRRHGYGRTAEEIEYETRVLHHAAAAGWRVPVPLGAPVTDGDRFASVCTYVPGTSHRTEKAPSWPGFTPTCARSRSASDNDPAGTPCTTWGRCRLCAGRTAWRSWPAFTQISFWRCGRAQRLSSGSWMQCPRVHFRSP